MGLRHNILHDPVSELPLRQLIAVKGDAPVRHAVEQMQTRRLGCVVILDDEGRPLGQFTERLLIRLLLKNPGGLDEPVRRHMASAWAWVEETDPIAKVIECMEEKKLRFVLVLDKQGHPVGFTGQKGVMEYIAEHFPRQVKVQEMDSKLYMDQREGA